MFEELAMAVVVVGGLASFDHEQESREADFQGPVNPTGLYSRPAMGGRNDNSVLQGSWRLVI